MKPRHWIALVMAINIIGGTIAYGVYQIYYSHPGYLTTPSEFDGLSRQVRDNTLISPADPAASITFAPEYTYLGAQKFILYGTSATEQYMFAVAHPDGATKSLVTVQFETLLPEVEGRYDYSGASRSLNIGPLDFWVDTRPVQRHWLLPNGRPGTDGERYRSFMASKGFPLPKDFIWTRLAYVPSDDDRKEMLILHVEDLGPTGFSGPDLRAGGDHAEEWNGIATANLDRLRGAISVGMVE